MFNMHPHINLKISNTQWFVFYFYLDIIAMVIYGSRVAYSVAHAFVHWPSHLIIMSRAGEQWYISKLFLERYSSCKSIQRKYLNIGIYSDTNVRWSWKK